MQRHNNKNEATVQARHKNRKESNMKRRNEEKSTMQHRDKKSQEGKEGKGICRKECEDDHAENQNDHKDIKNPIESYCARERM